MKERKPRREKHRIVARVDPEFHEQVLKFSKALGVKIQEFVIQALVTEMQGFDLQMQHKRLQNRFDALSEQKEWLLKERKALRNELKQIASKLGVPDTAVHCIQRIGEIEKTCQAAEDKLSVVEGDRDEMQKQRDEFESLLHAETDVCNKYDARVKSLKAALEVYRKQGFWERVFGRVPAVELDADSEE